MEPTPSCDSVTASCDVAQLPVAQAAVQRVRDAMLARPKTLPQQATVGQARAFFANPKVVSALLVEGTAFAGLLDRQDIPGTAADADPVQQYARRDVATVAPDGPMIDAMAVLDANSASRLVVLEADGVTLAGLLCLDLQRSGFCQG